MKKKYPQKLLLVADYAGIGGSRTYFISLLHFLKKRQYEVQVIMSTVAADSEVNQLIKALNFQILPVYFDFWCIDLDNPPPGLTKKELISYQLKEVLFWCKILYKNLFSTIVFSTAYAEQYLYAFLLPVKLRYILHTQPQTNTDKVKRWLLNLNLSPDKQIITVSASSKAAIEAYWFKGKIKANVKLVYNFYEPKYKSVYTSSSTDSKKILTIGSCEVFKNPFFFIECAKQIIDTEKEYSIEFLWAGNGSLLEECRRSVNGYPQIKFLGNVENVEELYAQASIYFQPSLQESHGIAILGAMYYNLPCIVSDRGGMKESVADKISGYVFSVEAASENIEGIKTLIHDKEMRLRMGSYGRKLYEEKFTYEVWEKQMTSLF